tara:strand:+ start:84 stop:764 length:681 start_codon:yes stop_codon:yes gene_type:complete
MGYPTIRRLRTNTFCDGGVARANDGALLAELQGNLAKNTNIAESSSYFDVVASAVRIFGDSALDMTDYLSGSGYDGTVKNGIVWSYVVPRPATLVRMSSLVVSQLDLEDNPYPKLEFAQGIKIDTYLMKSSQDVSKIDATYNKAELGGFIQPVTVFSIDNDLPTMNISTPAQVKDEDTFTPCKAGDCIFLRTEYKFKKPTIDIYDFSYARRYMQLYMTLTFKEEHQ